MMANRPIRVLDCFPVPILHVFSGISVELGQLSNLTNLHLQGNKLKGEVEYYCNIRAWRDKDKFNYTINDGTVGGDVYTTDPG